MRFHARREAVFIRPPDIEVERTTGATALFARWFPDASACPGALPASLVARLDEAVRAHPERVPPLWIQRGGVGLRVTFAPLFPRFPEHRWGIVIEEFLVAHSAPKPASCKLTPREWSVAAWVAEGRSIEAIATGLGCQPETVRRHLRRASTKLGIGSVCALVEMFSSGYVERPSE